MIRINSVRLLLLVLLFCFFSALGVQTLTETGHYHTINGRNIESPVFRKNFFSEEMLEEEALLSSSCRSFLQHVEEDSMYFPVPASSLDPSLTVSYTDSWQAERNYKEASFHEGTDIMASKNEPGLYPVVSISDGTVINLGWLELGGWRAGILSPNGVYYYYAHLDSYSDIKEGDTVKAGQLIGFMGDSGYGTEGTTGKFAVHLHLGIYCWDTGEEISVNPYHLLQKLETSPLQYRYS